MCIKKQHLESARLLHITDTHCYADDDKKLIWSKLDVYPNRSLARLLTHLETQAGDFDALIISGDLVEDGSAGAYQRLRGILQDFTLPVYILPGNHDTPELMHSELATEAAQVYFQSQLSFLNWQCLFLDTRLDGHTEGVLELAQLLELEGQLKQLAPDKFCFIFMHHNPVSVGSPWMDKMGLQQPQNFWDVVAAYPRVKAVAFGHIHSEVHINHPIGHEQVVQTFSTPSTCVQIKHIDEKLRFDHTRPAWRELILHADGQLETMVHYLSD